jgi:hypothetical protein
MPLVAATPVPGQSLNLDIGIQAGTPADTYAGAGLPGIWNNLSEPEDCQQPPVGLDGTPTSVIFTPCPITGYWLDHPETNDDDEHLLDDGVGNACVCYPWAFLDLEVGRYLVITYGWWGDGLPVPIWVLQAEDSYKTIGGPWPGHLEEGVTHAVHLATVTDGCLDIYVCGGFVSTAPTNGIQLVFEDCNLNGVLDEEDIANGTSADCNGNDTPDECEVAYVVGKDCNQTGVPDTCESMTGGDFDGTGVVDLADWDPFTDCIASPGVTPSPTLPECVDACLGAFDSDGDNDVDLQDFSAFQRDFLQP